MVSKATAEGLGCDLSVPGIDKEKFLDWFPKLKAAASAKDVRSLPDFVLFPLRVNTKPPQNVTNRAQLAKTLKSAFTDKVLTSIANQEVDTIFCRDLGVMTGNGEVWINQQGGKIGITAINP